MTFDYGESTAILGPLSTQPDPVGYDLCQKHSERLSAPRGWQVVRLADSFTIPEPNDDELMALANAVRAASHSDGPRRDIRPASYTGPIDRETPHSRDFKPNEAAGTRHGHLTLVDPPKKVS